MNQRQPTLADVANAKLSRELDRRGGQSVFTADGQLRADAAAQTTKGDIFLGEYLDLSTIPFADDPDGADHCTHLARLVSYMAELPGSLGGVVGGPLEKHEQKCLYAVAMLYSVGKKQGPERYAERSAAFADTYFRQGGGAGTYWGKPEVREDVCRLILKHNDERETAVDKRLQVFADAVRFEVARYSPNTGAGLALLKEQWKKELWWSGWAADKSNARSYMISRGWK